MTFKVVETRLFKGERKRRILRRGLEEDFARRVRNAREWENAQRGNADREVTVEPDDRVHSLG